MPRERHVYDSSEIGHLWAHATQANARNASRNFSFVEGNLYSYSTIIARRIDHAKHGPIFLLASRRWSATTDKHQNAARSATHGPNVFTVADIHAETYAQHKANVLALIASAETAAGKAMRARSNAEWHSARVGTFIADAQRYAKLFNVRGVKFPPADDINAIATAAKERGAAARAKESAAAAQRAAAQERERAAFNLALPDLIAQWRATGTFTYKGKEHSGHVFRQYLHTDLMRLDGDDVKTTSGAIVPARIVRRLAPLILAEMEATLDGITTDIALRFPGKTLRAGHYTVNHWTRHTVTVGCHNFTREEIATILAQLERAEIVPADHAETVA